MQVWLGDVSMLCCCCSFSFFFFVAGDSLYLKGRDAKQRVCCSCPKRKGTRDGKVNKQKTGGEEVAGDRNMGIRTHVAVCGRGGRGWRRC